MDLGRVIGMSLVVLAFPLSACSAVAGWLNSDRADDDSAPAAETEGGVGSSSSADAESSSAASPAITKLAYIESPAGPRILVAGTDPGERLESVWLDLLDENGEPAAIDPEGDGVTEPSQLEIPTATMERSSGAFFFEIQASSGLERFVRSVTASPQDRRGAMGERRSISMAPLPVRASSEPCDARGFDVCAEGLVCVDGADGTSRCHDLDAARSQRCNTAPVVAIGGRITGFVAGASLWDPEEGCASAARRGRPETVVRLHVPSRMPSLTLATLASGTTFDSVISVLDGCGSASKTLACNDDDPPPMSRVRLTDVAAGDYIVVIDSLDRRGGAFELAVTVP